MLRFARRAALASVAALAAPAPGLAPAADPMPCRGLSFADGEDAAPNRDIREGWFSFSGGRLTANLRLAQVDDRLETGEGSATFRMYYGVRYSGDRGRSLPRYVSARTDGKAWSFQYGDDDGTAASGATRGSVQAGSGGVVEIEIPTVHAAERDTLIFVHARSFATDPAGVTGGLKDYAPGNGSRDSGSGGYGGDFLVEPCPAPQSETKPPTGSQPQPTPGPQGESMAEPAPGSAPAPSPVAKEGPAAFTVKAPRLRARALRRAASFKVVIGPSVPVKALTVKLKKHGKTLASGRRASLIAAATVKLTVHRRIAKGSYRLVISGRRADGTSVTGEFRVRVA